MPPLRRKRTKPKTPDWPLYTPSGKPASWPGAAIPHNAGWPESRWTHLREKKKSPRK